MYKMLISPLHLINLSISQYIQQKTESIGICHAIRKLGMKWGHERRSVPVCRTWKTFSVFRVLVNNLILVEPPKLQNRKERKVWDSHSAGCNIVAVQILCKTATNWTWRWSYAWSTTSLNRLSKHAFLNLRLQIADKRCEHKEQKNRVGNTVFQWSVSSLCPFLNLSLEDKTVAACAPHNTGLWFWKIALSFPSQ